MPNTNIVTMYDSKFSMSDLHRLPLDFSLTQKIMEETKATKLNPINKSDQDSTYSNNVVLETMNGTSPVFQKRAYHMSGQSPKMNISPHHIQVDTSPKSNQTKVSEKSRSQYSHRDSSQLQHHQKIFSGSLKQPRKQVESYLKMIDKK